MSLHPRAPSEDKSKAPACSSRLSQSSCCCGVHGISAWGLGDISWFQRAGSYDVFPRKTLCYVPVGAEVT